jgi:hypothetical protein
MEVSGRRMDRRRGKSKSLFARSSEEENWKLPRIET